MYSCFFLFKHISLIVFFCNFAPENHNSQKENKNDVKKQDCITRWLMLNWRAFIKIIMSEKE